MAGLSTDERDLWTTPSVTMDVPFTADEFRERVERTRSALMDAGVSAAYFTSPEAIYYLTGFHSDWYQGQDPTTRPPITGLALGAEDGFIHLVHQDEMVLAEATTWGGDTWPVAPDKLCSAVAAAVARVGGRGGIVGLEESTYRPTRAGNDAVRRSLEEISPTDIVDISSTIRAVMRRKSPQELAYTRTAARYADIGLAAAREVLRPGVTEVEVLGEVIAAMSTAGAENPSIVMPVASGPKAGMLHGLASRRRILPGDVVNIDVAGVHRRYHADASRTFFVGDPPDDVTRIVAASAHGFDVLLDGTRAGRLFSEVLDELEHYYGEVGLLDDVCWIGGYELPASFPPDWVGEYCFDTFDRDDRRMLEGLVTNYESNFYLPQIRGITLLIDTMAIDGTPEWLHSTPRELIVIEA